MSEDDLRSLVADLNRLVGVAEAHGDQERARALLLIAEDCEAEIVARTRAASPA